MAIYMYKNGVEHYCECDAARERVDFLLPAIRARGIEFGPGHGKTALRKKSDKTHKQSDERSLCMFCAFCVFFFSFVQGPERGNVVSIARI